MSLPPKRRRVLVLDDDAERQRHFATLHAHDILMSTHDPLVAIEMLDTTTFDLVRLDHDLGYYVYAPYRIEVTGMDAVQKIVHLPAERRPIRAIVHSWNPPAAARMVAALRSVGVPTTYEPYAGPTEHVAEPDAVVESCQREYKDAGGEK